jgi:hypothetical protein
MNLVPGTSQILVRCFLAEYVEYLVIGMSCVLLCRSVFSTSIFLQYVKRNFKFCTIVHGPIHEGPCTNLTALYCTALLKTW